MSVLALLGLNVLYALAGLGLVWWLRGWASAVDLLRMFGLAYVLGLAVVVVALVELLVLGIAPSVPVAVAVSIAVAAAGFALGWRQRGRPALVRLGEGSEGEVGLLPGLVTLAAVVVVLEALFRAARLRPLVSYDSWAFWTQKAEVIHRFGGLDLQFFANLPGPSYPLFVPTVQATAFSFMGEDVVAVHVQFWLLAAGFVWAVGSLLRPAVPHLLIWPFMLLMLVMPDFDYRVLTPAGDLPLDFFLALAGLAIVLWLRTRQRWHLGVWTIALAAAMTTKREGLLLGACLVLAALVAGWREKRAVWPAVLATSFVAMLAHLPWRIWFTLHHFGGEGTGASLAQMLHDADRIWPAFAFTLASTFRWHLWLLAVPVAVAAACASVLRRSYAVPAFFVTASAGAVLVFTWILWSIPELGLSPHTETPIPRAVGFIVVLGLTLAPAMLSGATARYVPGPWVRAAGRPRPAAAPRSTTTRPSSRRA